MKIIFLDIDGVLNSDRSIFSLPLREAKPGEYRYNYLVSKVDPVAVAILNNIVKETGAKIVVSSANRKHLGFDGIREALRDMGVEAEIIGITGTTGGNRGTEIEEWLDMNDEQVKKAANYKKVESYVILDDSADFLEHQMPYFVHVNPAVGLDFQDQRKAIEILTGEPSSSILLC